MLSMQRLCHRDFLEGPEGKRSASEVVRAPEHGPTHDPFCLSSIPSRCLGVVGVEEVAAVEEEEVRCGVECPSLSAKSRPD